MMKRTIKRHLHIWDFLGTKDTDGIDDINVHLFGSKRESDLYIYLGEVDVTFDMPEMPTDAEINNQKVQYLRKGREEVTKEFATKLSNIDDQINNLLALSCDVDA